MTHFINQLGTSDTASIANAIKGQSNGVLNTLPQEGGLDFAAQLLALLEPGNSLSTHADKSKTTPLQQGLVEPKASGQEQAAQTITIKNPEINALLQNLQDQGLVTFIQQTGDAAFGKEGALTTGLTTPTLDAKPSNTPTIIVPVTSLNKINDVLNAVELHTTPAINNNSNIAQTSTLTEQLNDINPDLVSTTNGLGLDSVALFTQADGSAQAPLLENGNVFVAPVAQVLSGAESLSFTKTLSSEALPLMLVDDSASQKLAAVNMISNKQSPALLVAQESMPMDEQTITPEALAQDTILTNEENVALNITAHKTLQTKGFEHLATNTQNYGLAVANLAQQNVSNIQQNLNTPVTTVPVSDDLLPLLDTQADNGQSQTGDQPADQDLLIEQQLNNNFDPSAVVKEARRERSGFAQHILNNAQAHHADKAQAQVAMMLEKGANGQLTSIRLELDPASLGKVEIEFDFSKEGHVKALVVADKQETLDLLKYDARALEKVLEEAGFEMDQGDLEFDLRQEQQFDQNTKFGEGLKNDQSFDPFLEQDTSLSTNPYNTDEAIILSAESIIAEDRVNIVI